MQRFGKTKTVLNNFPWHIFYEEDWGWSFQLGVALSNAQQWNIPDVLLDTFTESIFAKKTNKVSKIKENFSKIGSKSVRNDFQCSRC